MKVSQEHSSFRHGQAMVKATACLLMLSAGSVITPVQATQESIGNAAVTATQQAGTVKKGVVRDVNGEPIIGASVVEKGNTSNGTVTDLDGNYTLKLKNPKAKLVVSYIGFVTQETTGGTITLQEDLKSLNEVVVIGYGTQRKGDVTSAVSSVKAEDFTAGKIGDDALGRIWNESQYPEDATQAYMRLFCNGSYDVVKKELFEYAQRCVTYDFDDVRQYVGTAYDGYSTKLLSVGDGYYQVTYGNCPSSTSFNVIPLEVPAEGSVVTVDLKGLTAGSKLADGDAGEQVNGDDQVVGTTTIYNNVARGKEGWTYGFVALKSDGTRVYGDIKLLAQAFVMDASKLSSYTIKPVLVYTKGGKQYKATITLNMKY